jgi:hypothetical protein
MLAKALPVLAKARASDRAAFSSSANALTDALPNAYNLDAAKTPASCLPN